MGSPSFAGEDTCYGGQVLLVDVGCKGDEGTVAADELGERNVMNARRYTAIGAYQQAGGADSLRGGFGKAQTLWADMNKKRWAETTQTLWIGNTKTGWADITKAGRRA